MKMRNILAMMCFSVASILTSCSEIKSEKEIANDSLNRIITAIQSEDNIAIKELFATSTIEKVENIDEQIENLISYYGGNMTSYDDHGSLQSEDTFNEGGMLSYIWSSYDVVTDEEEYRVAIKECIKDTESPENIGICYIYIIKAKDDTDLQYDYHGDDKETPGINIGIKNRMPVVYK